MENKYVPIGEIKLDLNGLSLVFNPSDDITAKDVALLFQMFLNALIHKNEDYLDFGGYMEKHDLRKHFVEISNGDTNKQ